MTLQERLGLKVPLIVAPMAGGPTTVALVVESCRAGALGSFGAAYTPAEQIVEVASEIRKQTSKPFALNLFVPHATPPVFDLTPAIDACAPIREELGLKTPSLTYPYEENFSEQFEAVLKIRPAVLSFVFNSLSIEHMKAAQGSGITLIGAATSPDEAMQLEEQGVDAVVLQGVEAGGHRASLNPRSQDAGFTTFELVRECATMKTPRIAAGGLMTKLDLMRSFRAGASLVQMGTAFLCVKEAGTSVPYRAALARTPRATVLTRAFSGRIARGIENRFTREISAESILPFPAQNKFTRDIRAASLAQKRDDFLSLWCGSAPGELFNGTTQELIQNLFN